MVGWIRGEGVEPVHYLPLATTALALVFLASLVGRYRERGGLHHLWWAIGVFTYGLGTALEGTITLGGNSVLLTRLWYVAGALLGAYPLAQGSAYLVLEPRKAHRLTALTLPFALVLIGLVLASPALPEALEPHRPSGDILAWTWVRMLTPLLNLYAACLLVGSAAWSAMAAFQSPGQTHRAVGNALIAGGSLLPAIGGAMAKGGQVEALYVAELAGLAAIFAGYLACTRPASPAPAT